MAYEDNQAPARGPANQAPEGEESNVSPDEQHQRSALMYAAGKSMYEGGNLEKTVKMLSSGGSPIENAARGAAILMHGIAASAREGGKEISDDALMSVGEEVIERMLALVDKTGLQEFQSGEEYQAAVDQATELALQTYHSLDQGAEQRGESMAADQQQGAAQQRQPATPSPGIVAGGMAEKGGM